MLGIGLGVSLYLSIQLITTATFDYLRQSVSNLLGNASLTINHGGASFQQGTLERVSRVPGVVQASGFIEERVELTGLSPAILHIVGFDLLRQQAVPSYELGVEIPDSVPLMTQYDSVVLSREFATAHGLRMGQTFVVETAHGRRELTVRGLLEPRGLGLAYAGSIGVMDIDGAQETFGKNGVFDRIRVMAGAQAQVATVKKGLEQVLGNGFQVETPKLWSGAVDHLVGAFQALLDFLSISALVVAAFLVGNIFAVAVAERTRELGILRAVGATPFDVLAMILIEALLFGALGCALGILLGRTLAVGMFKLMLPSIGGLFHGQLIVPQFNLTPRMFLSALGFGMLASGLGALLPALRAARISPMASIGRGDLNVSCRAGMPSQEFRISTLAGLALYGLVALILVLRSQHLTESLELILQVAALVGTALLAPIFCLLFLRVLPKGRSLALGNLLRHSRATGHLAAYLVSGLVLGVVTLNIYGSMRATFIPWYARTIPWDFRIASNSSSMAATQPIHDSLVGALKRVGGLSSVEGMRLSEGRSGQREFVLRAYDKPQIEEFGFLEVVGQSAVAAGHALFDSGARPTVLLSEPVARDLGVQIGALIPISARCGSTLFTVVGMIRDLSYSEGVVDVSRSAYRRYCHDDVLNAIYVRLAPGADAQAVRRELERVVGRGHSLVVSGGAEVRAQLAEMIDRSFAYLKPVQGIALLVVLIGFLNTVFLSIVSRTREFAILRAIGMHRVRLVGMLMTELGCLSMCAGVLAAGFGSGLSALWLRFIMTSRFDLEVTPYFPAQLIGGTLFIALVVVVAAAAYPVFRATRIEIVEALRDE